MGIYPMVLSALPLRFFLLVVSFWQGAVSLEIAFAPFAGRPCLFLLF